MNVTEAFEALELRIGTVERAELNTDAARPAVKLWIDMGDLGIKTSSAQLTDLYTPADLVGRQVIAAVNLGARRIAGFVSEVLVLGVPDGDGRVVLLTGERAVPNGGRVY
jgi:tRNA-binding protein